MAQKLLLCLLYFALFSLMKYGTGLVWVKRYLEYNDLGFVVVVFPIVSIHCDNILLTYACKHTVGKSSRSRNTSSQTIRWVKKQASILARSSRPLFFLIK